MINCIMPLADVVHLVAIFQQLQEQLHDKQRWSWFPRGHVAAGEL